MFGGLHAKDYIVWAAYDLDKSLKTKPVIQRRLEFLKTVRFGRYVLNELLWRASWKDYIVWAAYLFLDKLLKIKPVIQHRLDFLKALRFGRSVLNELVWCASCKGLHNLGRISILKATASAADL